MVSLDRTKQLIGCHEDSACVGELTGNLNADFMLHNALVPHSALGGLTPDEVHFGTGTGVPERLGDAWQRAREARLAVNRTGGCGTCSPQHR